MRARDLKRFVGNPVFITWKGDHDWPTFLFIGIEGNAIWLRGIDAPDGTHHVGDMFDVDASEIKTIKHYKPQYKTEGNPSHV